MITNLLISSEKSVFHYKINVERMACSKIGGNPRHMRVRTLIPHSLSFRAMETFLGESDGPHQRYINTTHHKTPALKPYVNSSPVLPRPAVFAGIAAVAVALPVALLRTFLSTAPFVLFAES